MRILIVDNYDSFTLNIFQSVARVTGCEPIVVRNDQLDVASFDALDADAIILSPGPGRPDVADDFGICAHVLERHDVPILGICLGYQGIATSFGGAVERAPEPRHGRASAVEHDESGLFQGLPQRFAAVRYHSLRVALPLPEALERIAWSDDGVLMGLRHRSLPIWGVQFHPESVGTEHGDRLVANFVELARPFVRGGRHWTEEERRLSVVPRAATAVREHASPFELRFAVLDGTCDAERAFVELFADEPTSFWLDSSRRENGEARFSFIGGPMGPHGERLTYDAGRRILQVQRRGESMSVETTLWQYLDERLRQWRFEPPTDLPFDFTCGFVGWFGYELKSDGCGDGVHRSDVPDAELLFADRLIAFDHETGKVYVLALSNREESVRARADRWIAEVSARLRALPPAPPPKDGRADGAIAFRWSRDPAQYRRDIDESLRRITEGESYEVCLTNHVRAETTVDALDFYRTLRTSNPAPYAGFLRFGDVAVACSSPERFLKIDRHRRVETKPIKGTTPRGTTPEDDRRLSELLQASEKSRSENMMVVDLLRNDLSLVCEIGSVEVSRLMHVESYATVHQLVSTIRGILRPGLSAVDCIRAAFPGGSMTGAPKVRTMEIIDRLETEARGVYSGAMGFLSLSGAADLNIVIRTAVFAGGEVDIGIGGAVVALSTADEEFDEILLKARALLRALIVTTKGPASADMLLAAAEKLLRAQQA